MAIFWPKMWAKSGQWPKIFGLLVKNGDFVHRMFTIWPKKVGFWPFFKKFLSAKKTAPFNRGKNIAVRRYFGPFLGFFDDFWMFVAKNPFIFLIYT